MVIVGPALTRQHQIQLPEDRGEKKKKKTTEPRSKRSENTEALFHELQTSVCWLSGKSEGPRLVLPEPCDCHRLPPTIQGDKLLGRV
jgi:hypothetical protein